MTDIARSNLALNATAYLIRGKTASCEVGSTEIVSSEKLIVFANINFAMV